MSGIDMGCTLIIKKDENQPFLLLTRFVILVHFILNLHSVIRMIAIV